MPFAKLKRHDVPDEYRISRFLGEFVNVKIEDEFRSHTATTDCRHGGRNLLILALMFFLFIFADVEVFREPIYLVQDILARGIVLVTGGVAFFMLRRDPQAKLFDRLVIIYMVVSATALIFILDKFIHVSIRPPSTFDILTVYIIATLISFVIFPTRLIIQLGVAAGLVFSYVGLAIFSMPPDSVAHIYAAVYLANVFAVGYLTSYRLHSSRREGWVHLVLERAATLSLKAEIEERQGLEIELRHLATTDPLTKISNRRHFIDQAGAEIERSHRYGRPFAVLSLDLDHFKRINDTHGHAVGDQALVAVVEALQSLLRKSDLLGRMGGEEFAIILPETDTEQASDVAGRARELVAALQIIANDVPVPLTVSIGGATLNLDGENLDGLLVRADKALYGAKRSGRNRVVFWSESELLDGLNVADPRTIN